MDEELKTVETVNFPVEDEISSEEVLIQNDPIHYGEEESEEKEGQ